MIQITEQELERMLLLPTDVLVEIPSKDGLNHNIKLGTTGQELYMDPKYETQWNTTVWVKVVKVCNRLAFSKHISQRTLFYGTEIEIAVGDIICLTYDAIHVAMVHNEFNDGRIMQCGDRTLVVIKYSEIILRMDGDVPQPVNGNLLVTKVDVTPKSEIVIPDTARTFSTNMYRVAMLPKTPVFDLFIEDMCPVDTSPIEVGDIVMVSHKNIAYPVERDILKRLDEEYLSVKPYDIVAVLKEELDVTR